MDDSECKINKEEDLFRKAQEIANTTQLVEQQIKANIYLSGILKELRRANRGQENKPVTISQLKFWISIITAAVIATTGIIVFIQNN